MNGIHKNCIVVALCLISALSASALVLYEESFESRAPGSKSLLNLKPPLGAMPGKWLGGGWALSGEGYAASLVNAPHSAYLGFAPEQGHRYDLSISARVTAPGKSPFYLGYICEGNTSPSLQWSANAGSPWVAISAEGKGPAGTVSVFSESQAVGGASVTDLSKWVEYRVVLDTRETAWTSSFFVDGTQVGPMHTFAVNPVVRAVGFGIAGLEGENTLCDIRDLKLDRDPIAPFVCPEGKKPMNVMFIMLDDVRTELGSYGHDYMKTPHIDRLAGMGVQFNRAYVQQAICAASRVSLLTGCRPETTGVDFPYTPWFNHVFRKTYKPMAPYFTGLGYYTRTLGKVHHGPPDTQLTEAHYHSPAPDFHLPENTYPGPWIKNIKVLPPWEHADLPDSEYKDGQIADRAVETIRRAVKEDRPFYISPGFNKPHMPFVCPKKYYDLYTDDDIHMAPNPELGANQPEYTIARWAEIPAWWKFPVTGMTEADERQAIHSYYACVSFTDAQIGKILDELEAQDLMDSTMIVLLSDQGWHLGEQGNWGKATCFENSTRSPLIIYAPGLADSGTQIDALVEYIDIFPTILEYCGWPVPDYMEGTSFVPLLEDPSRPWKKAAFSQFPRFKGQPKGLGENIEAYSVRTDGYRYTQWRERGSSEIYFEELYDNRIDQIESDNIASNPEARKVLETHRRILSEGWKAALPPGVEENRSVHTRGEDAWYYLSPENRKLDEKKWLKRSHPAPRTN